MLPSLCGGDTLSEAIAVQALKVGKDLQVSVKQLHLEKPHVLIDVNLVSLTEINMY